MKNDKRNIGRDPHIAPGVYYIQQELCARIDGDRIIVEKKESEDERMRKRAIAILKQQRDYWSYDGPLNKFPPAAKRQDLVDAIDVALSYLEKQKELPFVKDVMLGYPGLYFYDGERMHFQGNPAMEENPYDFAMSQQEKQKENPKSADSIPSDCMSDVKCEDRWHKTANSLPDNGRDVLAKDALGNYLIASFDGAQWFVSVYDGEDHPVLHTPPILEWCDIPSETCKESLHVTETCKENADSFTSEDERIRRTSVEYFGPKVQLDFVRGVPIQKIRDWLEKQKEPHYTKQNALFDKCVENCDPEVMKEVSDEIDEMLKKEQKPAEWSEEDEEMIGNIISSLRGYMCLASKSPYYTNHETHIQKEIEFLNALRPSWKPSEDEERLINTSISFLKDFADKGYENAVECIDWLKSKLNGNTGK